MERQAFKAQGPEGLRPHGFSLKGLSKRGWLNATSLFAISTCCAPPRSMIRIAVRRRKKLSESYRLSNYSLLFRGRGQGRGTPHPKTVQAFLIMTVVVIKYLTLASFIEA